VPLSASGREVDRARLAFRALPGTVKNTIKRAQRAEIGPTWKTEVRAAAAKAPLEQQKIIFRTGSRVQAGLPVTLIAGAGSKLPGVPRQGMELGSDRRSNYTRYTRRYKGGKSHTVTRRAARQMPPHKRSGYVVYGALARTIPKWIGSWSRAIEKTITDAANGG